MSSPQPQIQIRTHTVPLQKPEQIEEAEVNISDYLSKEVFYMLLELGGLQPLPDAGQTVRRGIKVEGSEPDGD